MNLSHISPGLVAMYWLGASMLTTAVWSFVATGLKRVARGTQAQWELAR